MIDTDIRIMEIQIESGEGWHPVASQSFEVTLSLCSGTMGCDWLNCSDVTERVEDG